MSKPKPKPKHLGTGTAAKAVKNRNTAQKSRIDKMMGKKPK